MTDLTPTPLLSALALAAQRDRAAFFAPGHKQGQGAASALLNLLGVQALRADLPELPELDNLFAPAGPIQQAQQLAAITFGAEETYFLANGSTSGLEAALLAVCAPGERLLVPRNAHRSVFSGLILAGGHPLFLTPVSEPAWDLAYGITPEQIEQALAAYPEVRAVVVVSPSYHGVCADIAAIAPRVHDHGAVLIVDEAHGAHLGFHEALPASALAAGADIVVQSTHKVLSALTQAAMLHLQGSRVDRPRLRQCLALTQSTSPNYWLLASLDAARQQMAVAGRSHLERTITLANRLRSHLQSLAGLTLLTPDTLARTSPAFQLDLTRLTIDVSGWGMTGFQADESLHHLLGVTAELPTLRQLTFIVSLGNTAADGDRLVEALHCLQAQAIDAAVSDPGLSPSLTDGWEDRLPRLTEPPLSPREAFFAPTRRVAITAAIDQIAADPLCPYPPGIPLVLPGERITAAAIAALQQIQAAGGVITGGGDAALTTVRIVDAL